MKTKILRNDKGFTLIEMAIVLVIIGLILGAVIKGKDVLNSAKQKKFYTSFIKTWELTITSYYDRTGGLLGDGSTNGATGTANGEFNNVNSATEWERVNIRIEEVGLDLPTSNLTNNYQYSFAGTYSGSTTMDLDLMNLTSVTDSVDYNTLSIDTMPTDLAIAIDTMVDGKSDPTSGNFRQFPEPETGTSWPNAKTTPTVAVMYIINLP